ncbi:lysophospholipid acyltransferase family protein [Hymenobacter profundi]|uniref:Lysophospholipid acyltransferase family protein n=1 Tax=Hymenobacter profundi TaxID=1982110 RepID=A0ABS6WZ76_9BACT|nr:lysophospholipid acyltransferase family protein [Hymenobacter profundi]MBW3127994.1 lysophospholipid acyltransferase family protein [Hymenobacter profundi]
MLFYTVMKPVVQVALRVFFRKLEIRRHNRLQTKGPLLIASNHPNTLMDPLVVAANRREPVFFLAKSTFFKNPILRAVMESGNCIPVYRRQDTESGAEKLTPEEITARNEAAFSRSYDHFDRGGTLMIFPEGTSVSERRLRPLKTGAARIALGAEARRDFQLGLHILPIGINYFDPTHFRSDVLVNPARLIRVADYAAAYRQDPEAAADALTEEIRQRMEKHLVITRDASEDELVLNIERTFGDHLNPDDDPNTLYDNFQLSRTLLQAVTYFEHHDPNRLNEVREKLTAYLGDLHRLRLTDEALEPQEPRSSHLTRAVKTTAKLVLGLPVYLYGVLNNYVPYILPSVVAKRATKDVEFVAPLLLSVGIITFSASYAAQTALVHHYTKDWRWTALYFLSLPITGFYALSYWNNLEARRHRLRASKLFRQQPAEGESLLQQRADILRLLSEASQEYLAGRQAK